MSEAQTAAAADPAAAPATPATTPPGTTPEAAAPDIFDAAGEPAPKDAEGNPTRPDWMPEAFWDPETKAARVEALARSHAELRAKISRGEQKAPKAPDDYKLPRLEGLPADAVAADDPLWTDVRKAAHEMGLSQAQLEHIAKPYLARVTEALAQQQAANSPEKIQAAYADEIKRLGPEGPALLRDVKGWMDGLKQRGILSDHEIAALRGVTNADGVRALSKLRQMTGEAPIPISAVEDGKGSLADAQRMMVEGHKAKDMAMVKRGEDRIRELEKAGVI